MLTLNALQLFNPTLYASLKAAFGKVKIMSMGVPMQYTVHIDSLSAERRRQIVIHEWGESYKVCCPKCGDKRFRLLVNHRHGTFEEAYDVPFGNKVRCFNESCDHTDFDDRYLKPYMNKGRVIIPDDTTATGELMPAISPGRCAKLTSLTANGDVLTYLRNRKGGGFDPKMLEDKYNVSYCFDAADDFPLMTNRLLIPVYYHGMLVGWQGRAIDDEIRPKYYTMPGFPKGRVLFNFDVAKSKPFVVVCEGVFDAIRVGDCAVAVLGSQITSMQSKLLYYNWKHGAMLILFDPDDEKAQERARTTVKVCRDKDFFRGGVANIVLPEGKDAADMNHDEVWQEIYRQCEQQQIRLMR